MGARLRIALATVIATILCLPSLASAHAVLERSEPVNDIVLPAAPTEVTLTFSEPVEPIGRLQLFDENAAPINMGDQRSTSANVTRTSIDGELTPGTYTVVWRALSADGHAINGAFVFHVVKRGANPNGVIGTIGSGEAALPIRVASGIARFFDLAILVLLLGGIVALSTVLSRRGGPAEPRLWYVVSALGFALSVAAAATIVLQGAEVRGVAIGGAAQGGVIGDVLSTQFGQARLAQLLLAEIVAVVAVWGASSHRGFATLATLWVCGAALAVTPALSGHATSLGIAAIVVDAVHVVAVSIWVGGLVFVALALAFAGTERGRVARDVLPRFSRVALVAVGVVIVTGAVNGLRHLDGLGSLWSTRYGAYLLIKVALGAVLVAFGALNRRLVGRMAGDTGDGSVRGIRRQTAAEIGVMACVLVVTTLLVAEPPARTVAAGPVSATTTSGDLEVRVVADPARTGPNLVHVYLSRAGRSVDVDEVRVAATLEEKDLGPVSAPTERNEPGHYVATSMPLSGAGEWRLVVTARRGEFDATEATVQLRVRTAGGS